MPLESSQQLFMAGDNLNLVWCNYRAGKQERTENIATAIHQYGTGCPAAGCIRCDSVDCYYARFIRKYWDCPGCD